MVSRRRFLRLGTGVALAAATGGCLDGPGGDAATDSSTPPESADGSPETVGDAETTTPGDVPTWDPDWSHQFADWHALGLDAGGDGTLFTTLSREGGASAVAAFDIDSRVVRWRTEMEGEAVGGSHADSRGIARGGWGVTLDAESVYAVAGRADEREWTALHAFDRATGERRWSLERDRELAVAGVADGLLVAAGLEFFPGPNQTPTSHQTPEEPLTTEVYGIDPADGRVRWTREFVAVNDVTVGDSGAFVAADGGLTALGRDGETRYAAGGGPATRAVLAGDRVIRLTGANEGATLAGFAPSGEVEWRYDAPVHELLRSGDRVYAGGDAVVAIDADGTVGWRDDDYGQWLLLDPDADTLYTRSGVRADAATAYDTGGAARWTFDPPSNNAWPEAATEDALVATAITADDADDLFYTLYAVEADGEATAAFGRDTVFDAVGVGDTAYLTDGRSNLLALTP